MASGNGRDSVGWARGSGRLDDGGFSQMRTRMPARPLQLSGLSARVVDLETFQDPR